MRHEPLSHRTVGRWHGILTAIGISSKTLRNKHGPCPMCGGKDRFRFDDKGGRGTWICSHCGAGDGIELVKQFLRVDFRDAAKVIEQHIGAAPVTQARGQASDGKTRQEMAALWKRSSLITLSDCAGQYLNRRLGITSFPECLRFSPDERYTETGNRPSWHPMMVARVDPSDAANAQGGERSAIHRTYLDKFGGKADVGSPRKMMGSMPSGASVRLIPHDDTLGIAEGIETALAASILFNMPVWAALTAGLLQDWTPPLSVSTVFIFGDNDASSTGQAAAYALAQKLKARGVAALVELPTKTGEDWADVLTKQINRLPSPALS